MKNIYTYRDYRQLLRDFYNRKKQDTIGFTYGRFAQMAELNSPNYLKLVMDGERSLTTSKIHAFAKGMNLQGHELDFFECLVLENQSETKSERNYYSRRLSAIRKNCGNKEVIRQKPGVELKEASRVAIKLCSEGKTWDQALKHCTKELGILEKKANESLTNLLNRGEIILNQKGILNLSSKHIMASESKGINQAQKLFLKEGLSEGQKIFEKRYSDGMAKFLSVLFTAEPGSLPFIFNELRESLETVAQKYDPSPEQESGVYRAQIQVYRFHKNQT